MPSGKFKTCAFQTPQFMTLPQDSELAVAQSTSPARGAPPIGSPQTNFILRNLLHHTLTSHHFTHHHNV
jgi:hypothetical protein